MWRLSVQGGTLPTPNIDRLANEGLTLTNFNVQNHCTSKYPNIKPGEGFKGYKYFVG